MEKSVKDSQKATPPVEMEKAEVPVKKWKKDSLIPWGFTFIIVFATIIIIIYGSLRFC